MCDYRNEEQVTRSDHLTFSEGGWGSAGISTMLPCTYERAHKIQHMIKTEPFYIRLHPKTFGIIPVYFESEMSCSASYTFARSIRTEGNLNHDANPILLIEGEKKKH